MVTALEEWIPVLRQRLTQVSDYSSILYAYMYVGYCIIMGSINISVCYNSVFFDIIFMLYAFQSDLCTIKKCLTRAILYNISPIMERGL